MPYSFQQDLAEYKGQEQQPQSIGGSETSIGAAPGSRGIPSFQDDLKEYQSIEQSPVSIESAETNAMAALQQAKEDSTLDQKIADKEAEYEGQKQYQASFDVRDDLATHQALADKGEQLTPTANIEIDYANTDLTRSPITAVPEGTVGGHCGVFAENIVKLPDGGNWIVGDSIKEKKNSLENYRQAGLAFKPGEAEPQVGNAIIQDTGTKWGHVAVINKIDPDGTMHITESNWNWDKKVTHNRKMNKNDKSIVGFIKTK